jgi:UPF0755 protein
MKKVLLVILALCLIIGLYVTWKVISPATYFKEDIKFLYIPSAKANKETVMRLLARDSMIQSPRVFSWMADRMNYWQQIKPGKYKIESGNSNWKILRLLRNGQQTPVNLVIKKLRTKEDLASLVGRKFECDSAAVIQFLNNPDSTARYQLDSNTIMTAVFPNTYTYFWNITPGKIFSKLVKEYENYWTFERRELAKHKGLTPQTAYILASIVEEETNKQDEKGNIASVYLNRMEKGMRLGADPTVKFALRDFGLRRIYNKHLSVESPYNTYRVYGLPPGPICTPSERTIDAVLRAPQTNYLFFVAKSDFSGYHTFAENYPQHLKYAKDYQEALNKYLQRNKPAQDEVDNR